MPSNLKIKDVVSILRRNKLVIEINEITNTQEYSGLATDSRKVLKDNIFICLSGYKTDGHLYAESALKNGASLIISERPVNDGKEEIIVTNTRLAAAYLCREYYKIDTDKMKLVGVTGTNGKSTTAFMGYQLAMKTGKKAGFIGTIGYYINEEHFPTSLTTPDILDQGKILWEMQQESIEIVFIEISSHALALHRTAGLEFSAALFLNLSQDHLDFHENMDDYFLCKSKLFSQLKADGISIINIEDRRGKELWGKVSGKKYSISSEQGDIIYNSNKLTTDSSEITLTINNRDHEIRSGFSGEFNVQNLTFALASISLLYPEISIEELIEQTPELKAVPGRLEKVINPENKAIIIDYAHSPEAIEKVCNAMSQLKSGRLITIIGAGGNRDRKKRPLMLRAALQYSDLVIVTTDNPRNEDPLAIIKDIVRSSSNEEAIWIKEDRKSAIMDALYISQAEEIVLITGKGHETYQEIHGIKHPFDDRNVIKEFYNIHPHKHYYELYFDELMLEFICNNTLDRKTNRRIFNIITDTRKLQAGSLFIPLRGENFDGHDYLATALNEESNIALSSKDNLFEDPGIIMVDDPLQCYGMISKKYRSLFSLQLIGITGSTGKTSVKEYLYNILSENEKTIKTYSNENNYIGVPKTLLKLDGTTKYGIIELGTNHFGEIKWLTNISKPDLAIITNIGASHLEFLENEDGVYREKIEIFSEGAKYKIFPGDDPRFIVQKGEDFGYKPERKYRIHGIYQTKSGYAFKINDHKFMISAQAEFQVTNAAIAIVTAMCMGINPEKIRQGISKTLNLPLRMEVIETNGQYIIADCYNANPQSMLAALNHWKHYLPERPHIAILGSMLELGENSKSLHHEIGNYLSGISDLLISVGEEARNYNFKHHFDNVNSIKNNKIIEIFPENAVILLKGSHGIHLEKLLKKYDPEGLLG